MSKQDDLSAAQGDQILADMIHFRQIVSEAVALFSESMGLLLLLALLKLPPARDCFMQSYRKHKPRAESKTEYTLNPMKPKHDKPQTLAFSGLRGRHEPRRTVALCF